MTQGYPPASTHMHPHRYIPQQHTLKKYVVLILSIVFSKEQMLCKLESFFFFLNRAQSAPGSVLTGMQGNHRTSGRLLFPSSQCRVKLHFSKEEGMAGTLLQ